MSEGNRKRLAFFANRAEMQGSFIHVHEECRILMKEQYYLASLSNLSGQLREMDEAALRHNRVQETCLPPTQNRLVFSACLGREGWMCLFAPICRGSSKQTLSFGVWRSVLPDYYPARLVLQTPFGSSMLDPDWTGETPNTLKRFGRQNVPLPCGSLLIGSRGDVCDEPL